MYSGWGEQMQYIIDLVSTVYVNLNNFWENPHALVISNRNNNYRVNAMFLEVCLGRNYNDLQNDLSVGWTGLGRFDSSPYLLLAAKR